MQGLLFCGQGRSVTEELETEDVHNSGMFFLEKANNHVIVLNQLIIDLRG